MTNLFPKSDRELRGLRGDVKVCTQQCIPFPSTPGSLQPESRVEFTREGMRVGNGSEKGVTFGVEDGRKTKVRVSHPEDYKPNLSMGGSPFSIADRRPNLPDGGTATIYFDEADRPVEAKVRDSHGELVSSAVRIYDEAGHIMLERLVVHHPAAYLPLVVQGYLSSNSPGVHVEDEARDLMKERTRTLEFDYNEHGDPKVEVNRAVGGGDSSYSERLYSYPQYDTAGNWTEKSVASRSSENVSFEPAMTYRRTLEYY